MPVESAVFALVSQKTISDTVPDSARALDGINHKHLSLGKIIHHSKRSTDYESTMCQMTLNIEKDANNSCCNISQTSHLPDSDICHINSIKNIC